MSIKIVVRQDITEYGMFSGDWGDIDMDASAQKYLDTVLAKIEADFPDAEVDVEGIEQATLTPVEIITDSYETEDYHAVQYTHAAVEDILNDVYNDYETWVVNS